MKKIIAILLCVAFLSCGNASFSQSLVFNHIINEPDNGGFQSIAQDKYGIIWFTRYLKGLQRFDGSGFQSFLHDPYNTNSLANNWIEHMVIDKDNIFWLGTWGSGLDRFDPLTKTFTHYRHDAKNAASLGNDTLTILFEDRSGNLWIGSLGGLDMLDKKTGNFIHYRHDPKDPGSLSYKEVRSIYEDRSGTLWIGCGRPFLNLYQRPEDGGLNRLDKKTGRFKQYRHNAADPKSISDNKVKTIFEDSKGNLWIGTRGDGLQILNRQTGDFTHFYYDSLHPEKLSRPAPVYLEGQSADIISFITEDKNGGILIGTHHQGINYYDPATGKVTHYGHLLSSDGSQFVAADTLTGLKGSQLWRSFISKEGIIWIISLGGHVFTINPDQITIPSYTLNKSKPDVNTLYCEPGNNTLWIGTDQGLFKRNLQTGEQIIINKNSFKKQNLPSDSIVSIKADNNGWLWLATGNGLCKYDPVNNKFINYSHDDKNPNSLSSNNLTYLFFDAERNLWIGTIETGIDKLDTKTGKFTNYRNDNKNRNSISDNLITGITQDRDHLIWIATSYGVNSLNPRTDSFRQYMGNSVANSIYLDTDGVIWMAIRNSVYFFNKSRKEFQSFIDSNLNELLGGVINITEDKEKNLWLSAANSIIRINSQRNAVKIYDSTNGVHFNGFLFSDNTTGSDGKMFLGDQDGFYAFYPKDIEDKSAKPLINFTNFKINNIDVSASDSKGLIRPIWETGEIKLNYRQNNFSFDFDAVSYTVPGKFKFLYRLENYDNIWHHLGNEHKVYFFNLQPGKYLLHIRAVRKDGVTGEKTLSIIISPPWYNTWWAYALFTILFIAALWAFIAYRSRSLRITNSLLEEKVNQRTNQLNKSLKDLKSAQAQLIQSEKMAGLGELTAGIAHEIQNPLNFVNNFSDVNTELVDEATQEIDNGNISEAKAILNDIKANEEKINYHGKRADAIVKGMLQHSRINTGTNTPTDINKLADEYLRLAYHGLRAKDKSFNAALKTEYDESIDNINIIPQEIGRVLLNLINNAFYAVSEKKKQQAEHYEPTVSIKTKKMNGKIEVCVKDNGNGIPQKIVDKIFQPFFTTKPTGLGTGLGLSLSYDIVKAHGGEIKVDTKEGEGSEFIIQLPSNENL